MVFINGKGNGTAIDLVNQNIFYNTYKLTNLPTCFGFKLLSVCFVERVGVGDSTLVARL